jgi:hypothetical protein
MLILYMYNGGLIGTCLFLFKFQNHTELKIANIPTMVCEVHEWRTLIIHIGY